MDREEVVIWTGRGLLYADKPKYRKAAPSKSVAMYHTDVILPFRQVFDTVKRICERCYL